MDARSTISKFARFAWFVLAYNVLVILWGVFLRASKSGDGCGQHWLTCQGEVLPSAPELKTIIEFSHRLTTGPAFIFVLILFIWAFRKFGKGDPVRKVAALSFAFIITEVLIGAVLVLTGNTAEAVTSERPFLAIGHLINSFLLIAFLALTAWFAGRDKPVEFGYDAKAAVFLIIGFAAILLVGSSGSVAALSNMLFPSQSLAEGISKDFSTASSLLLRLRLSHPILSILTGVYLIFIAGWLKTRSGNTSGVTRWSNILSIVVVIQLGFGAATLLTLAPIIMQIGHLFLADLLWISYVLLAANYLAVVELKSEAAAPRLAGGDQPV